MELHNVHKTVIMYVFTIVQSNAHGNHSTGYMSHAPYMYIHVHVLAMQILLLYTHFDVPSDVRLATELSI